MAKMPGTQPPRTIRLIAQMMGACLFDVTRVHEALTERGWTSDSAPGFSDYLMRSRFVPPFPKIFMYVIPKDTNLHANGGFVVSGERATGGWDVRVGMPPSIADLAAGFSLSPEGYFDYERSLALNRKGMGSVSLEILVAFAECAVRPYTIDKVTVPSRVSAKRARSGKRQLQPYSIIRVPGITDQRGAAQLRSVRKAMMHHKVRGHWRPSIGKQIAPYERGDKRLGEKDQIWRVE